MKSQKLLLNFGKFETFGSTQLAGNRSSEFQASQDALHIAKKMKNFLFDQSDLKRLGKFSATLGHLSMVFKRFPKSEHGLSLSDLDPTDHMNYT